MNTHSRLAITRKHRAAASSRALALMVVASVSACGGNSSTAGSNGVDSNAAGSGGASTGAGRSEGGLAAGRVSSGIPASGGAAAQGGSTSAVGSPPTTALAGGSSVSSESCTIHECARNLRCVTVCGGAIIQDSCCSCPEGSFDSLKCAGSGGASSIAGASGLGGSLAQSGGNGSRAASGTRAGTAPAVTGGSAGASSKGGAGQQAGAHSGGGAVGFGGTNGRAGTSGHAGSSTAAGTSAVAECKVATDCEVIGDCCGCHAVPLGKGSDCTLPCPAREGTSCSGFTTQPNAECLAGRCTLNRSCNGSRATCMRTEPTCDAGQLPPMGTSSSCWEGPCIDIADCADVRSCSQCKAAGLLCVADNGAVGIIHCVEVTASCAAGKLCACFGELCGNIRPCTDLPDGSGIACGAG